MNFSYACVASFLISAAVEAKTMTVVDLAGVPQPGAQVLIGTAQDQPFSGNRVITDANGQFQVPTAWTSPQPITIEGNDIVRNTQLEVSPITTSTLRVSHTDGNSRIELQGTLTDFGTLRRDGKVDVGVFIPAIPQDQLIYFDIGWMVSSEYDVLRVLGREIAIPSNIAMPKQEETYFFPITLDKPTFRMFVRRPGNYDFLTLHAQFPLNRVADDFRAGVPPYEMVNYGTILESGRAKLNVQQKMSGLNLPVNSMAFSETINVVAPTLAGDDVVLTVALSKMEENGPLIPSDVKKLKSGQAQTLRVPAGRVSTLPVSVWLKEKDGNLKRFNFRPLTIEDFMATPFNLIYSYFQDAQLQAKTVDYKQFSLAAHTRDGQPPQFLNLLQAPRVNDKNIQLTPPQVVGNVKPMSTVLIYSSIRLVGDREIKTEERTRLWEVSIPGWVQQVNLPNLQPLPKAAADKYRWEVLYLGQDGNALTHVSRNAVDL